MPDKLNNQKKSFYHSLIAYFVLFVFLFLAQFFFFFL